MTYAFTDIHGNYNLWEQIKNFLNSEDKVYFLGDACDRGENGVQIMKEMLFDERVIYLKGNHEEMMVNTVRDYLKDVFDDFELWLLNGGAPTLKTLMEMSLENLNYFINKIDRLPYCLFYESKVSGNKFFLSHSGYYAPNSDLKENTFKHKCLWDRKHIKNEYKQEEWVKDSNIYIVHGHTPVRSAFPLEAKLNKNKPVFYFQNSKINLDLGTANSNKIALLNLDTFEIHYFYDERIFKNE